MKFYDINGVESDSIIKAKINGIKSMIPFISAKKNDTYGSINIKKPDNEIYDQNDEQIPEYNNNKGSKIIIDEEHNTMMLLDENENVIHTSEISYKICQGIQDKFIKGDFDELSINEMAIDDQFIERCISNSQDAANRVMESFNNANISFYDVENIVNTLYKEISSVIRQAIIDNPSVTDQKGRTLSDDLIKAFFDNIIKSYFKNNEGDKLDGI